MLQSVEYSPIVMPSHPTSSVSPMVSRSSPIHQHHHMLHTTSNSLTDPQGPTNASNDQPASYYHSTYPRSAQQHHHHHTVESIHHNNNTLNHTTTTPRTFFHNDTKTKEQAASFTQSESASSSSAPSGELDATALESLLEISKPRPSSPRSPSSPTTSSRSNLMSSSPSLSSSSSSECLPQMLQNPESPRATLTRSQSDMLFSPVAKDTPAPNPFDFSRKQQQQQSVNPSENDAAEALLFMKKSDSGLNLHLLLSGNGNSGTGRRTSSSDGEESKSSSSDVMMTSNSKTPIKRVKRHCVKCGKTNEKTWRRGPTGEPNYCNACGVRWSRQQKKDEMQQRERGILSSSSERVKLPRSFSAPALDISSGFGSDQSQPSLRASDDGVPRSLIEEISIRSSDDEMVAATSH